MMSAVVKENLHIIQVKYTVEGGLKTSRVSDRSHTATV